MKITTNKIFIIDTMALIYRAHFAMVRTPRITSYGLNTSAVYGVINSIFAMIERQTPTHLVAAIDSSHPTFRHEEILEYKAHRNAQPEDITTAIPLIKKFLELVGINLFEIPGYEADDIIGTITKKANEENFEIYIMSPDKDFAQLLYSDNIFIYKPNANSIQEGNILSQADILKNWDIQNVSQVCDILGLQGDASDNIPGVPGIGPKIAAKLIKSYGTVENLLLHAHELKGFQKESLEKYAAQALISKKIATIFDDVPFEINCESFRWNKDLSIELLSFFNDLELKSLAKRFFPNSDLTKNSEKNNPTTNFNVHLIESSNLKRNYVESEEQFLELMQTLSNQTTIAIYTEKLSIASEYIYIAADSQSVYFFNKKILKNSAALIKFSDFLSKDAVKKVFLNAKDFLYGVGDFNLTINNFDDLQILMGLVYGIYNASIESIAQYVLQKSINLEAKGLFIEDYHNKNFYSVAVMCITLDFILDLLKQKKLDYIYYNIELPLISVLYIIEKNGIAVDNEKILNLSKIIQHNINNISDEIFLMSGEKFNIASPKQLGVVLFEKLKISEKPKKTKSGQYSTDEEALKDLLNVHPIVQKILEFRELQKLKTNYIDVLPSLVSKKDNLLHTTYNQASVVTGRLSSSNPNLQTIPIKTEAGRKIRQLFIPSSSENLLLSADYSQIELRVIAAIADDRNMKKAFLEKIDIHTATASKIFGVSIEEVTSEMRRIAKTANFGIIYGISAFGLAKRLSIPKSQAQNIIDRYFEEFSAVKKYMENTIDFAQKNGFVTTVFGRRQYLADINSKNNVIKGYAERNAINMPIQGTAAEIVKIAMISLQNSITESKLQSKLILQVHDELLLEVVPNELARVKKMVREIMESKLEGLDVNFDVNIKVGKNWLDME